MRRAIGCLLLACTLTRCTHLGRRATIYYTAAAIRLSPNPVRFTLKRSFIEAYKDRVTIETNFTVDEASGGPAPNLFDGDFHFAGRAPEIGLRLVAEIMNAADADSAVALVKRAAKSHRAFPMTGAWRLWPEHALGAPEEQDRPMAPLENPYPDHVFEVHPVTTVGGIGLLGTFHPVEGYRPGAAKRTFGIYQKAELGLRVTPTTVTFETPPSLFNDVHFLMEITGARQDIVEGGRFVTASALDTDGNLLVEGLRMVFIKGTAPERAVSSLRRGDRLHVYGLPRVSFAEVSRRVRAAGNRRDPLEGPLPYELVILGVFPTTSVP
jgi:hypothetical protein